MPHCGHLSEVTSEFVRLVSRLDPSISLIICPDVLLLEQQHVSLTLLSSSVQKKKKKKHKHAVSTYMSELQYLLIYNY